MLPNLPYSGESGARKKFQAIRLQLRRGRWISSELTRVTPTNSKTAASKA
jgi:hypothetical protein